MPKSEHPTPHIRRPYEAPQRVRFHSTQPSRTKQSFVSETDVNGILAKFQKTGVIDPRLDRGPGSYGDFTSATDYHTSLNQIVQAQEAFYDLPSRIRSRFHNDPGELLAFLDDPDNRDEAVKLGLVNPPPPQPEAPKGRQEPPEEATASSEPQAKPVK